MDEKIISAESRNDLSNIHVGACDCDDLECRVGVENNRECVYRIARTKLVVTTYCSTCCTVTWHADGSCCICGTDIGRPVKIVVVIENGVVCKIYSNKSANNVKAFVHDLDSSELINDMLPEDRLEAMLLTDAYVLLYE